MNRQQLATTLRSIFVDELGLDEADVTADLQYNVAPEWDSVGHMHLIAAIEERFAIEIPDDDVVEMTSFDRIVDLLSRLVAANEA